MNTAADNLQLWMGLMGMNRMLWHWMHRHTRRMNIVPMLMHGNRVLLHGRHHRDSSVPRVNLLSNLIWICRNPGGQWHCGHRRNGTALARMLHIRGCVSSGRGSSSRTFVLLTGAHRLVLVHEL